MFQRDIPVAGAGGAEVLSMEARRPAPETGATPIDGDSLDALFRGEYRRLVRAAVLLLDDEDAAEDVVQEALLRVHGRAPQDPLPYLRRTVANLARSRMRRRRIAWRRREPVSVAPGSPEECAIVSVEHLQMWVAVVKLPRRQREVVICRYYLDLTEAEIADTLGIAIGSVKSHAHRALATLKSRLEVHHDA